MKLLKQPESTMNQPQSKHIFIFIGGELRKFLPLRIFLTQYVVYGFGVTVSEDELTAVLLNDKLENKE